jgi:hypothetical protein
MMSAPYDKPSLLGGFLLIVIGALTAAYAVTNYNLGSASLMGPGMVPTGLGALLAGLGIALAVTARSGPPRPLPTVAWRPLLGTSGAIVVFVLSVDRAGLIPAVFLMNIFSVVAGRNISFLRILGLGIVLALAAALIFVFGLKLPLALIKDPF